MRVLKKIRNKWMTVVEVFNARAKRIGMSVRWHEKTIFYPFVWAVISTVAFFVAKVLIRSELSLELLFEKMAIGFLAYCIVMGIQWLYVSSTYYKNMQI